MLDSSRNVLLASALSALAYHWINLVAVWFGAAFALALSAWAVALPMRSRS